MQPASRLVYLDNNATTRLDPRVFAQMSPYFMDDYGNAASNSHMFGWCAKDAVDRARQIIADALNASSAHDIIFTSGATESINLALKGIRRDAGKNHIITALTEHKAVLDTCAFLERAGVSVTYLKPQSNGLIDLEDLASAITDRTYLISIMTANNETGVIQDIQSIGKLCRDRGILFHTDATQAIGKIPFDVKELGVNLASFSAHKFYGPKGIGALYADSSLLSARLDEQIHGGGHEGRRRSGTLNVPGIVGFAAALKISLAEMPEESLRIRRLRSLLYDLLSQRLSHLHVNGTLTQCLPGTLNLSFEFIDADALLMELQNIALSAGSACTSSQTTPSHVLKALGVSDDLANASIRFSIGRFNTEEEIRLVVDRCVEVVSSLQRMSPLFKQYVLSS